MHVAQVRIRAFGERQPGTRDRLGYGDSGGLVHAGPGEVVVVDRRRVRDLEVVRPGALRAGRAADVAGLVDRAAHRVVGVAGSGEHESDATDQAGGDHEPSPPWHVIFGARREHRSTGLLHREAAAHLGVCVGAASCRPFFSRRVQRTVPLAATPVFLLTPGPVRWKLSTAERSETTNR